MLSLTSAAWSARGEDAVVTYYASGKLVVAGKGADAFVDSRLGWEQDEREDEISSRVVGIDASEAMVAAASRALQQLARQLAGRLQAHL